MWQFCWHSPFRASLPGKYPQTEQALWTLSLNTLCLLPVAQMPLGHSGCSVLAISDINFFHFFFSSPTSCMMWENQTSIFGIQSSHGLMEIATAAVPGICFSNFLKQILKWELSLSRCYSVLHPPCPSCPVSTCLKSWPAETRAGLHPPTACFHFSLVQSRPGDVAVKAVAQSPRQDSDGVLMKLSAPILWKQYFSSAGLSTK